ncbi:MAG: hypothetical protein ABI678_00970 [Kofleriaceae bacterium]
MRRLVVVCFYIGACGGGDGVTRDAALDAPAGPRCDPTAGFGTPKPLTSLNGPLEDLGGRLAADQLEILFSRTNADQTWDIYSATRGSIADPFGTPQVIGAINTIYSELWPTVTPDGLTLYFMSDRVTPNVYGIWTAKRTSPTGTWGPPTAEPALMTGDGDPFVANATALYFASGARTGAGSNDIYRATLGASGALTMIGPVIGGVDTTESEVVPVLTADELHMFFARQNGTDYDIYEASRSSLADGFGAAAAVPGMAGPGFDELPSWVSPDGCDLYFSSAAGVTGSDLFVASRP